MSKAFIREYLERDWWIFGLVLFLLVFFIIIKIYINNKEKKDKEFFFRVLKNRYADKTIYKFIYSKPDMGYCPLSHWVRYDKALKDTKKIMKLFYCVKYFITDNSLEIIGYGSDGSKVGFVYIQDKA